MSFVAAAASALVLTLKGAGSDRRDFIERATPVCATALALLLIGLAFFREFPYTPGTFYRALLVVLAAASLVGSLVAWRRRARDEPRKAPMPKGAKVAWLALSHTALLLAGWYLGRMALPTPTPFENLPSALVNLSPRELDTQLATDLERLKVIVSGIDELERHYQALDVELRQKQIDDERDYYLPEEKDRIRALFMTYLSYRSALLRMVATYVGFEVVHDENTRARSFTLGYTAAMTTFKSSLQLISTHRGEVARLKLNEAEREWGIPAGMFDRIYEGVTNERNMELAMEMAAYELQRRAWREASIWPEEDFNFLEGRILDDLAFVQERPNVCSFVGCCAARLLRTRIRSRAHDDAERRPFGQRRGGRGIDASRIVACERLRQSEIEQFDVALGCDHDVRGLQVAVDHTLVVGRLQSASNLGEEPDGLIHWNGPSRNPRR